MTALKRSVPLGAARASGALLACALASAAALAVTGASSAVVGGTPAEIQQAPWQVLVSQLRNGRPIATCGGTIVDASRIVTAAHCVYSLFATPVAPSTLAVRAGISDYVTPHAADAEQTRNVASYRIHPGYEHRASDSFDDVAVLSLDVPLDLAGPNARAVSLPTGGQMPTSGQTAMIAGFGQQISGSSPSGALFRIDSNLEEQSECGIYNAIVLCASSPSGSACSGDSGSALVLGSMLVGVASTARTGCPAGGRVVYTSIAAPEILRFLQGEDAPPPAPRRLAPATLDVPAAAQVGQTLACDAGSWTAEPAFVYRFFDHRTGTVLQQGRTPTYVFKAADVGKTVGCAVAATTAGGTGATVALMSGKVASAPLLSVATATAEAGRSASVRVTLAGVARVTGNAEVCVKPSRKVGAASCRTTRLGGGPRLTTAVMVPIDAGAPALAARVAVSAILADGRKLTTVGLVRIRR